MAAPPGLIAMATVGAAHGLKGEVRVKSFSADPLGLGDYGPLRTEAGHLLEIAALRPAGGDGMLVVRFKGVDDRSAVEALKGETLFIPREKLPAVADEEFYHADLIGLSVRDREGREAGRVTAVENFGGGDLLELTFAGRKGMLIPFTLAAVPQVSVREGFVTVDPVAAGLVDTGETEEGGTDAS